MYMAQGGRRRTGNPMARPGRLILAVGAAALAALTACSSASSTPSSTSTTGTSSSTPTTGSTSTVSSDVAQASAAVAPLLVRPTSIGDTTPVGKPIPKGKTIIFIPPSVPSALEMGPALAAAAKVLGWTEKTLPGGSSPDSFVATYEQAIREHPSAIFGAGIPPAVITQQLQQLAAMKIPVVLLGAPVPTYPGKSIAIANIAGLDQHAASGAHLADWVTANSDGHPDTLVVGVTEFPVLAAVEQGFAQEYSKVCPGCSYAFQTYPVTTVGTTFPETLVGYLRTHPKVDYVAAEFTDMWAGVPAALKQAGITNVKLVGDTGGPTDQVNIAAGNYEQAVTMFALNENPWRAIDILARYFAGVPITPAVNAPYPEWLLTKANQSSWGGPPSQNWPLVANYQTQYEQLWGVNG
jgi:ABC-type sugar transport system substrate-binding protein